MIKIRFLLVLFGISLTISLTAQDKKNYLALGDSYTIGESVEEHLRWPNQLVSLLDKDNIQIEKPLIIAKTGWRTDELINAIEKQNLQDKYDLVSLLIGVNNQYQNKSIEVFKKEFFKLINIASQYSKNGKKGVFVLSIPDYGATPFGQQKNPQKIEKEIQGYNAVCREICRENNIPYYEITEISKQAKNDLSLVASDGLHPSGKMYTLWVEQIIESINKTLVQ